MTGRRATSILNGPSSRGVRHALAAVLTGARLPAPPPIETTTASQFAACPRCGSALQFPTEQATGRLLEHCDHCGFHRVMPRQTAAQVEADERARFDALVAAEAADPLSDSANPSKARVCDRCGAPLPPKRVGVRGRRFCKDRKRCLGAAAAALQRRAPAQKLDLAALCERVRGALPSTRKAALSIPEIRSIVPELTVPQLRRALRTLVRSRRVGAEWLKERIDPTGGRPPKGYWSTRP